MSTDQNNPVKIQCGYRIMEQLAPIIKDFPYGIKTSGDIDTANYREALTNTRKWFSEKKGDYEIIDESF